jgi:hypothetical protein
LTLPVGVDVGLTAVAAAAVAVGATGVTAPVDVGPAGVVAAAVVGAGVDVAGALEGPVEDLLPPHAATRANARKRPQHRSSGDIGESIA